MYINLFFPIYTNIYVVGDYHGSLAQRLYEVHNVTIFKEKRTSCKNGDSE